MLINHRTAQLGVVNQKRPEVWQSYLVPQLQQDAVAQISLSAAGDHKLKQVAFEHTIDKDGMGVVLNIGDHKLIDPTKMGYVTDDTVAVNLAVGDHKLIDPTKTGYATDDTVAVNLAVGDHKLYISGVRAEVLDEDNFKVSLAVGDHKLYKEQ